MAHPSSAPAPSPAPEPDADAARAVDALVERALGGDVPPVPFPARPAERARRGRRGRAPRPPRARARLVGSRHAAALGVVVVLAAGLAVTTRLDPAPAPTFDDRPVATRPDGDGEPGVSAPERRAATPTTVLVDGSGVAVTYAWPDDLALAYRSVAPDDGVTARGEPACADGLPEERAWSRPEAPEVAVGRYRCTVEAGVAVMWWSVDAEGLLGRAARPDADLAALFAWWRAHADAPARQ